jgi:hypothetical protein
MLRLIVYRLLTDSHPLLDTPPSYIVNSFIMASTSISVPPYFCTTCQKQFKPQGFASHHRKCLQRFEIEKRDREFEANLNHQAQESLRHTTAGGEFC